MITTNNFKNVLENLKFIEKNGVYSKKFEALDFELKVDFNKEILMYPEERGFKINERQTCNFKQAENFVVFECVHRLLTQGYHPKHIELEPKWQVGHGASGGRADILVKDNDEKALLIIECKTAGKEFENAWKTTQHKPTQLFSYVQQTKSTKFIALYASDFIDNSLKADYFLINVTDNEELLLNDSSLKSFKEATTVEEIYEVWRETYEKEYTELGLFESNKPYEIGKSKFSLADLQPVSSKDIQGKYHKFASILRKYNVSGRENAFDKLVNLFLCKVVDEKENPNELKFYWKGKAYDNPFDFQDRLQKLYKNGMKEFLGEDITYIDNTHIDEIFKHYDLDTIKTDIKEVLKEQKFFTNNDFAFIDVHNRPLFYQNFQVLLEVARLIQNINLTNSDENQFLGDMFEGFLDQGVKQSEGQFFTPMPIVKFIINALAPKEQPKVIDYACGAGHFLNEYFTVNQESEIVGIEKEYRLSKVAKVSSFMYGSDMKIVYSDALAQNEKIKENHYDVLIANPPYSVKGFLETLSEEDRKRFTLTSTIEEKSHTANNAIECFFMERAKHLLSKDGVAGIVVPSSILNKGNQNINTNKGNVYVGTREILLKYFEIVAIAEFGSGTFGKTGTNTVTLFLKRRCDTQNLAGTFAELADKLFDCKFEFEKALQEKEMLQKYCNHIEVDFETYKSILCDSIDEKLFGYEMFQEYQTEFLKLTETKNRKTKKQYKALSKEAKEAIEQKELLKYLKLVEKDKFYYYTLAYKNQADVVIVKSPSKNSDNKKFLGYEWSSAKGNEGIHYITKSSINVEDESLEEEDKRILENLQGLRHINTPLYNPQDLEDESKINKIIRNNFEGVKTTMPDELTEYVSRAKLVDMLDFSRVDFNKALSLNPSKKIEIESKYPLVKLDELVSLKAGSTPSRNNPSYWNNGTVKWLKINDFIDYQSIYDTDEKITQKALDETGVKLLPKDIVVVSIFATIGRVGILKEEMTTNQAIVGLIIKNKKIKNYYLMYAIKFYVKTLINQASGSAQLNINGTILKNMKIPLPPLDIQEKIVKECQKVDDAVVEANEVIEQTKKEIESEISSVDGEMVKITSVMKIIGGGTPKTTNPDYWNGDIPWLSVVDFNNDDRFVSSTQKSITQKGLENSSTKILNRGDIIISARGTVGALAEIFTPMAFNQSCYGLRPDEGLLSGYLYYILKTKVQQLKDQAYGMTFDTITSKTFESIQIPLPPLKTQKQIVSTIEKLESKIEKAQKIIDEAQHQKEAILKKYL